MIAYDRDDTWATPALCRIMNLTGKPMRSARVAVTAAMLVLVLSGCASLDPFQRNVASESPAAPSVEAALEADHEYPTWAEFPAAPTGVLKPADVAQRVAGLERQGAALVQWAQDNPQMVTDTSAFAAQGLGQINRNYSRPAPANAAAQTEAFARAAKALATPPPLAK